MNKQTELDAIAHEIETCRICPAGKSGKPVPGEGSPHAEVIFIGEAPGKMEAATGRPFVGRSGQLLRSLIREVGVKEEDIFITSPVKYLPDRGTPTKKDIEHGMIHTKKQIDVINPRLIVLLGSVAAQGVLGKKLPVLKMHGDIIDSHGRRYMLTLHPAAGLRFPPLKEKIKDDFLKLRDILTQLK